MTASSHGLILPKRLVMLAADLFPKGEINIIFSYAAPYYPFQEVLSTNTFVFPVEVDFPAHPSFSLKT